MFGARLLPGGCSCGWPTPKQQLRLKHEDVRDFDAAERGLIERALVRYSTAVHEGGHAVVGRSFGWPVVSVEASITKGSVRFGPHEFRGVQQAEREHVIINLAGIAAETAAFGNMLRLDEHELRTRLTRSSELGSCDICQAISALRIGGLRQSDGDLIAAVRSYENQLNTLVRRPHVARQINIVAGELIHHHKLAGGEIEALLGGAQSAAVTRYAAPLHQTRSAMIASKSFDPKANNIEVIWSTGAKVRRNSWIDGPLDEELAMGANNVRLGRLNSGAPFLNSHAAGTLEAVIGSVVPGSAKVEKGRGVAKVQLSKRAEVAGIVQDIRDGIIRSVSCGYRVHAVERTERKGQPPLVRVVDWEPLELSAVAIAADDGAQVRSTPAIAAAARMRMRQRVAEALR